MNINYKQPQFELFPSKNIIIKTELIRAALFLFFIIRYINPKVIPVAARAMTDGQSRKINLVASLLWSYSDKIGAIANKNGWIIRYFFMLFFCHQIKNSFGVHYCLFVFNN